LIFGVVILLPSTELQIMPSIRPTATQRLLDNAAEAAVPRTKEAGKKERPKNMVVALRTAHVCEDLPIAFVPKACALGKTGFIPDEVSNVPGIDGDFRTSNHSSDWAGANICLKWPRGLTKNGFLWHKQFGNAFLLWAEDFARNVTCAVLRASSANEDRGTKLGSVSYCRDEIRGDGNSDVCKQYVHARRYSANMNPTCWWNSYGYGLVVPALQQEWARFTFAALRAKGLESELPCSHVQALPVGVAFMAIHLRCGDIAKHEVRHHFMTKPKWWRNFLPAVAKDLSHAVIFGNRKQHSDAYGSKVCDSRFSQVQQNVENITGMKVHVAPELSGTSGKIRDVRCMIRARELVLPSFGSSFSTMMMLLHEGCRSFMPYPTWKRPGNPLSSWHRMRANQHFINVTKDMVWTAQ